MAGVTMLYYRTLMMQLAYHVPFFNRSASSKATLMCYLELFFDFFLWIVRVRNTEEALEETSSNVIGRSSDRFNWHEPFLGPKRIKGRTFMYVYVYIYRREEIFTQRHIHIYIYIHIYICVYIYTYTDTYVYVHTYFYDKIYLCIYGTYVYIVYPKVFCFHSNSFMFPSMALS